MKKRIISFLTISLLLTFLLQGCFGKKTVSDGPSTLTVYGLDSGIAFDSIIARYKQRQPEVTVKYKKFANRADYEELLVNQIAEGEGPDVFYIHNTWLPRHIKKLAPLASETLTPPAFAEVFVNVARNDFIQTDPRDGQSKIYALPLFVDTLALYYNKDKFEQVLPERGKPAKTWAEFNQDVEKLRKESFGALEQGGVALGRSDNLSLAVDILYSMFLQNGVALYDAGNKQVRFAGDGQGPFADFLSYALKTSRTYSYDLSSAVPTVNAAPELESFVNGKVAAFFGYSDAYGQLETYTKKSQSALSLSDVGVAPFPQVADDAENKAVLANYYGLAVSRASKNPALAWDFAQFATSQESARSFYEKTKRPTSRRDLIEEQKKKPITETFVGQLGIASSYRVYAYEKFAQIIKEAIASANGGQDPRNALNDAQGKVNELLQVLAPEGIYPKVKAVPK